MASDIVRIGNAQGFWGDRSGAAADMLAREPELDFLTLDYLAEVSMSILAGQRNRDSTAGYARDFLDVIRSLGDYWRKGGRCRLVTNAGGLNVNGCAEACRAELEAAQCPELKIATVTGDDVLESLRRSTAASDDESLFRHLDTAASISEAIDQLVTANAYLGAEPIAQALSEGAHIVVTGRTADPSLAVGACMHYFGWESKDWPRLAGATVAGHLIECGAQVTGGISTDWLRVPDPANIGFPIVEIAHDGSCVVTKPVGTGGRVSEDTVKEQLLYELGDPDRYLSPDVTVSFLSLTVDDLGNDRVRVSGARGAPAPDRYKVSATYRDGYRASGMLTVTGRDALAKARTAGEIVLRRVTEAGFQLRSSLIECLGAGDTIAGLLPHLRSQEAWEVVLRVAVEAESVDAVECFSREFMPLITAGPQGICGYAGGRPRVQQVIRYWPCLIRRDRVIPRVSVLEATSDRTRRGPRPTGRPVGSKRGGGEGRGRSLSVGATARSSAASPPVTLFDVAYARSGDKGMNANVGVLAHSSAAYEALVSWLTADRVASFFEPLGVESVERFEMPNLNALNFLLYGVLRNGLRTDVQGKTLGQALLEMPLDNGFMDVNHE